MTDAQKLRRLKARCDFMESMLIQYLIDLNGRNFPTVKSARDFIREGCEKFLSSKFKYPIKENDE